LFSWLVVASRRLSYSSAGNELIANAEGPNVTLGYRFMSKELGVHPPGSHTEVFTDATAVMNGVLKDKVGRVSRYLSTRQAMLRQGIDDGVIELVKTPGTENVIDIGTKPLVGEALHGARSRALGIRNESNQWGRADPEFEALLSMQTEHCPRALDEVRRHGKKISHWAWYVFPLAEGGKSIVKPRIHDSNVARLFARAPRSWREVIELVCTLVDASAEKTLEGIIPPEDHQRVKGFCEFFGGRTASPRWMGRACDTLAAAIARQWVDVIGVTEERQGRGRFHV